MSERRACKVLDIYRSSHRYLAKTTDEEGVLLQRIAELATQYVLYPNFIIITRLTLGARSPIIIEVYIIYYLTCSLR